jgi:hypothetical protein
MLRRLSAVSARSVLIAIVLVVSFVAAALGLANNSASAAQQELAYDDGTAEFYFGCGPGCVAAVKFNVAERTQVLRLRFGVRGEENAIKVHVLDANFNSIYSQQVMPRTGWLDVDISRANVYVTGDFYVGFQWLIESPNGPWLGDDNSSPVQQRSYLGTPGSRPGLAPNANEHYLIRAVVESGGDACRIDSDGDGVADCRDGCPYEPGPSWNDGCPDLCPDSDGDGLTDCVDECPREPGPPPSGCPDPCALDSDRDGVPDCRDRCANTSPGTRVDEFGCPPLPPGPTSRHANLEILVAIYTGGDQSRGIPAISSSEVARLKNGLALARLFYWRNSKVRLNLSFTFLEIPTINPLQSPVNFEADLVGRGVKADQYDGVYIIGNDLDCWASGGTILGKTALAVGRVCGVPYPGDDSNIDYTIAWCFTHEFQHNLDGIFAAMSGHPEGMLHGHLEDAYAQKPFSAVYDAGTHYDWQAFLLRYFNAYNDFSPPWDGFIETVDQDQDGFPDNDPRVPMDEARFGSTPLTPDTDNDGLTDLEEFFAGIFKGSNPNNPDTDGDGILDGDDIYPLSNVRTSLPKVTPSIDGMIENIWTLHTNDRYFSDDQGLSSSTYAGWDENYLYFAVKANRYFRLYLRVDGSGDNGLFQGGDSYEFRIDYGSNKLFFVGEQMGPHGGYQEHYQEVPNAKAASRESGGSYVIEVAIPKHLGQGFGYTGEKLTGLTLTLGRKLGFDIILGGLNGTGDPRDRFSGKKAYVFEPHRFYDLTLVEGIGPHPDLSIEKALDKNDNNLIDDPEFMEAIDYWISGREVPGTGGLTITDAKILELMRLWVSRRPISSSSAQSEPIQTGRTEGLTVKEIKFFPNPIKSTNTVVFRAEGSGIAGLKLEVFNLVGARVLEQEASGDTLKLYALDDKGRPLANGVYLYVVTVRGFNGEAIRSGVRKLVILR